MDNVVQRNPAKEPVTIRLDVEAKAKLQKLAEAQDRTVSSLIDLAVREFLDRQFGGGASPNPRAKLKVRHAALPDTSVLRTFCTLAPDECAKAKQDLNLPDLEFVEDRPEWRRLPLDVFSGESDLVESVNWLPIWAHVKRGGSSPRLDWVGPYLMLFVGHHIFVRRDLINSYLSEDEVSAFEEFRGAARNGRDLSLRSLVAWARQFGGETPERAVALESAWADAVVGCQLGTDYHIAVRRLGAILAGLAGKSADNLVMDPAIPGLDSLHRGFQEFRNGTVTAFTGSLLQSADLLTRRNQFAYLLAGPADLRIPSLNTLAGCKGMFEPNSGAAAQHDGVGGKVLALWSRAVSWFRDRVINADSDDLLRKMVEEQFPDFADGESERTRHASDGMEFITVLKSLMQTWVKWFAHPEEARAFLGEGVAPGAVRGNVTAEDLVQYYEELCDLLNPSRQMTLPVYDEPRQREFWKFPTFSDRPTRIQPATGVSPERGPVSREPSRRPRKGS